MAIGDIIVSLDIGASKTAAAVGQINKFGEVEVVGYGLAESGGIKKGKIIDNEPVARSIVKAITQAEETSGLYINSAYVNIKGMNTRIERIRFKGDVEKPDDGLSYNDINKMMETIQLGLRRGEREEIISISPIKFNVNDREYKEEPIGAFAKYFIMDADVVLADKLVLDQIQTVMKLAELKIDGYVLETYANSNVVLMPEEKEMGVLMLDIGAAHTEVSVYKNSNLEFNTTIPVGGDHITSDIVKIIEARVKEVYQITRKIMAENNLIGKCECVVLTGQGFSNIAGTEELAVLTLKINQVRTCSPRLVNVIKPQHALAYGMLKYISTLGLGKDVNSDVEIVEEPSITERVKDIFKKAKEKIFKKQNKESEDE